ncbi:MAG: hypothetical protein ACR2NR_19765, partial [Solirubrobacteraceae bacterium]
MPERTASRTLVKSAPELWAECSDAASLAKHLGAFGEIRITKLEPGTTVAWEGAAARGTVSLEPSGWGTRVVLTATEAETPARTEPSEAHPAEGREISDASEGSAETRETSDASETPSAHAAAPAPRGRFRRAFLRWPRRPASAETV